MSESDLPRLTARQMIFEFRPGRTVSVLGIPYPLGHLVLRILRDPRTSPDMVLIAADGLAELRDHVGEKSPYFEGLKRLESSLHDIAPIFGASHAADDLSL